MEKISDWKAVYMIVNIFVGLGILSKPYALAQGGFISLMGLTAACMMATLNALLIIECFKMTQTEKISYPELGYAALGNLGKWFITILVHVEISSYMMIILIVLWENISYIFSGVSYSFIVVVSCAIFLPILWISTIKKISVISMLGVVSNILIFGTVIVLFCSHSNIETTYHIWTNMKGLSLAVGIYIVALGGHIAIPTVYKNMKHPENVKKVVCISFFCIWLVYMGMAVFGYLFFGKDVSVIITKDIKAHSSIYFFTGMVLLIILKLYCTIPSLLCVIFKEEGATILLKVFKLMFFIGIATLSYHIHDFLPLIEAISGTVCIMNTSMILPLLLYIILRYRVYEKEKQGFSLLPLQTDSNIDSFKWWKYTGYFMLLGTNITIMIGLFINQIY